MFRRLTTALVLVTGAALFALASPAGPAAADTTQYSSVVTLDRPIVPTGGTLTVTASQVVDGTGAPMDSGVVWLEWGPSPFDRTMINHPCPTLSTPVRIAPYVCTFDLSNVPPGFYSAVLIYGDTLVSTAAFLVTPPLQPTITQLAASSPLTVQGGTLTATITHSDGSSNAPGGTVDFTEGTTTLCSGIPAYEFSASTNFSTATCALSTLSLGTHHVTATYSGDTGYAGSSGSLDVTVSEPVPTPPPAPALEVTTTTLPAGQVGESYAATLTATGGTTPLHWSLAVGQSLPAGLTLDPSGTLAGIPTGPAWTGSVGFVVTDSASPASSASTTLPLTIKPAIRPTLTGLSPTSGPTAGGTLVTLRGKNLDHAVRVTVGGKVVAFTVAPDGLSLTLHTPRHAPGKVAIVVYGAGSTKSSIAFTFHR